MITLGRRMWSSSACHCRSRQCDWAVHWAICRRAVSILFVTITLHFVSVWQGASTSPMTPVDYLEFVIALQIGVNQSFVLSWLIVFPNVLLLAGSVMTVRSSSHSQRRSMVHSASIKISWLTWRGGGGMMYQESGTPDLISVVSNYSQSSSKFQNTLLPLLHYIDLVWSRSHCACHSNLFLGWDMFFYN